MCVCVRARASLGRGVPEVNRCVCSLCQAASRAFRHCRCAEHCLFSISTPRTCQRQALLERDGTRWRIIAFYMCSAAIRYGGATQVAAFSAISSLLPIVLLKKSIHTNVSSVRPVCNNSSQGGLLLYVCAKYSFRTRPNILFVASISPFFLAAAPKRPSAEPARTCRLP